MTTTIIVDDTDPEIHYIGDWAQTGSIVAGSNEYNNTVHEASSNGLGLLYKFNGTRIYVYGTVDSPVTKGTANSTYSVDGYPPEEMNGDNLSTITDIQSHILLYKSPTLLNGKHTLNISLINNGTNSAKYYFDFFTIEVPSAPSSSHVIVDDQDGGIKYSGNWTDSHSFNEYLGTDREAPDSGNASATYLFNGTSISVYGTVPANADPVSSIDFVIDSGPSTRYNSPFSISLFGRHTLLYSTSGLSQGRHNLTINAVNSTHWWLDYLIYTPTSDASPITPSTGGGGTSPSGNGISTGTIVGGVIGAVIGLAFVGVILYFLARKWRTKKEVTDARVQEGKQFQSNSTVPGTADNRGLLDHDTMYTPTTGTGISAAGGGMMHGDRKGVYQRSPLTPDIAMTIVSDAVPSTLGLPEPTAPPRREVDGGIRLAGSSVHSSDIAPSTLPPLYGEY